MARLFSAVVSNYNHATYIGDAVRSVLACGDPDSEVIVVDDGSTDGSREVLTEFQNHPQVKVVLQENGGQTSAFNRGYREAQGEIIALFDGDDFWFPHKIRECRALIADHGLEDQHYLIRHPLLRMWDDRPIGASNDEYAFDTHHGRIEIPWGTSGLVTTPERELADLRMHRFPIYLGGRFGGSTVAARKTLDLVFPLPEGEIKHYGDTYPITGGGLVAPVYGLMKYLGVYRMHGGNHSITRGRAPMAIQKLIERHAQEVLDRLGVDIRVSFEESLAARPYLMEQGRLSDVLLAQRARATAGSAVDQGLAATLKTYAVWCRSKLGK